MFFNKKENGTKRQLEGFVGVSGFTAKEISLMYAAEEKTSVRGFGVLHIARTCDRTQLYSVVERIDVQGWVIAPQDVREHYGLK